MTEVCQSKQFLMKQKLNQSYLSRTYRLITLKCPVEWDDQLWCSYCGTAMSCCCVCVCADRSTWAVCSLFQTCVLAACREPPSAPPTSVWHQWRFNQEITQPIHRQQGESDCLCVCLTLTASRFHSTERFCVCVCVRSVCLLLQVALPCALYADTSSQFCLKGGTNAEMAPQIDYTVKVHCIHTIYCIYINDRAPSTSLHSRKIWSKRTNLNDWKHLLVNLSDVYF